MMEYLRYYTITAGGLLVLMVNGPQKKHLLLVGKWVSIVTSVLHILCIKEIIRMFIGIMMGGVVEMKLG